MWRLLIKEWIQTTYNAFSTYSTRRNYSISDCFNVVVVVVVTIVPHSDINHWKCIYYIWNDHNSNSFKWSSITSIYEFSQRNSFATKVHCFDVFVYLLFPAVYWFESVTIQWHNQFVTVEYLSWQLPPYAIILQAQKNE